ncbi:MAG: ROK family protein [Clostridiaceae bacterium]|jgi:glucokinase|nr:ROK family protein [Clostridiaceae bacterium]
MYYIGVDLGGTNIAAGIVDDAGKIVKKASTKTGRNRKSEEIVKDMCRLVLDLMKDAGLTEKDIYSIGIGSPGSHDRENGIILYNNNLNFKNVNIKEAFQKHIDVPIYLENDANCAAIAENVAGAAKGYEHSVTITIGTGIGGGVIINNKLFTGTNGMGAELGHIVIDIDGEYCTCGRKGCWEAYSAAPGLISQTRKAAEKNPDSKIHELCGGNLDNIDAKTAFDAARLGDKTGMKVIDDYIGIFGEALANIINIFQPDVIVIGGGVSKEGDNLLIPLKEKMRGKTYGNEGLPTTLIVVAQMGNDAGIVGAAFIPKLN